MILKPTRARENEIFELCRLGDTRERERTRQDESFRKHTNKNQTIETSKQAAANKRKTTLPFFNGVFKPVKHQNFGTLRNARNIGKRNRNNRTK